MQFLKLVAEEKEKRYNDSYDGGNRFGTRPAVRTEESDQKSIREMRRIDMSRVLKFIVNVILIIAIATAAALLIPTVLDVPMVVVDDVNMDTNLPAGSVTYAREKSASQVEAGDQLVISQDDSQYVYEVQSVNGETCTLEDTRSADGGTQEITLPSIVDEVLITIPFIGYASMALRSTEGLIIVGLAVVFVIILFILAEIWKKDDDDEEETDGEDREEEEEEEEEEEIPAMSRKEARRRKKAERKQAKKEEKASGKAAEDAEEEDDVRIAEPVKRKKRQPVPETGKEPDKLEHPGDLFAETENSMASAIADMMEQDQREADPDTGEDQEEWKPAMPVRTKEELLKKAHADGDEPEVRDDEVSGVTLIDYSDIL